MQKKYLETKTTARLDFVGSLFGEGLHNLSHNKVCFVSYVCLAFILFSYQIFHLISCANIFSLLLPLYVITDIFFLPLLVLLFSDWTMHLSCSYHFSQINFCNSAGEFPRLIESKSKGGLTTTVYYCAGKPLSEWFEHQPELEAAFNVHFLSIDNGRNDNTFILKSIPANGALPTKVPFSACSPKDFVVNLGVSYQGEFSVDFSQLPHMLVAGSTNGGKTNFCRCLLFQLLAKGATVYLVDLKEGGDYLDLEEDCNCLYSHNEICTGLNDVVTELRRRLKLFRENGVAKLEDYNKLSNVDSLQRIFVLVDEASILFDTTAMNKEEKAVVAQIEKSLLTITRLGRAAGCHAIICTQRPDIDSCSGALKSNIEIRVSTHCADTATSMTILGTGDAAKLPKISGRFVAWDGTIFQSYYFPNYK